MGALWSSAPQGEVLGDIGMEARQDESRKRRMRPMDEQGAFRQLDRMSPELLAWLLQGEELYSRSFESDEPAFAQHWALKRAVDQPLVPTHHYFEGYAHGLLTPLPIQSMNPRFGTEMEKHRAPVRIVAFLNCFKQLNALWMREAFAESPFSGFVEEGYHLGDVAFQFHWGDAIAGDLIGWHCDGPNSYLHLAIGLLGHRVVHLSQMEEGHTLHPQQPGDIYLGTPHTIRHGVEYPSCEWNSRVLALQCRFLIPSVGTEPTFVQPQSSDHICKSITNAFILVPTLEEVQAYCNESDLVPLTETPNLSQ